MKKLLLFISLVSVINAVKGNYSISYGLSTNHVKYGNFKNGGLFVKFKIALLVPVYETWYSFPSRIKKKRRKQVPRGTREETHGYPEKQKGLHLRHGRRHLPWRAAAAGRQGVRRLALQRRQEVFISDERERQDAEGAADQTRAHGA